MRWGGGPWEGGRGEAGKGERRRRGKRRGSQTDMMEYLGEADRMPAATEGMAITDSYKHMECRVE